MLDLNISNGPSSPLPLGRLWVSGLLLSLDFRCCRCFWNHPHPTIRCCQQRASFPLIHHGHSVFYVAQHIDDRIRGPELTKHPISRFTLSFLDCQLPRDCWIGLITNWPIQTLRHCWLVSNRYDPLTSMHFHVNKVAPLPRGSTSLSAGNPQSYPATAVLAKLSAL
ncbi:hypothetical protein B0H65DRAFT_203198 [Neurospora tetraspora]|uniref:Uncharacterized protein n=1 Tax=Neurospora tetraspora TaxID=94610 RepID=A0AAE0JFI3_9PEZI|nr:hypothetical protein B0H65DRAFT_203198 [Neurospora tetraspora]